MKASNKKITLCVVSPCYNEESVIEHFYLELKKVLKGLKGVESQILFVDDGSKDRTLEVLNRISEKDRSVSIYAFSRNFGHQAAVTAGIREADADVLIVMDSDLQHPPELIPEMLQKWREGFDIVSGVRDETEGTTFLKKFTSKMFYWLINRLSDTPIVPGAADFGLISRQVQSEIKRLPERHVFLRGLISWVGFNRYLLHFYAPERKHGKSKYTLKKMLSLSFDAVFSFSTTPIRAATHLGFASAFVGALYLTYVIARFVLWQDLVKGWASTIAIIVFMGGIQLACMGLLGEYLARVFEEVKGRPLYIFKQRPNEKRESANGRIAA